MRASAPVVPASHRSLPAPHRRRIDAGTKNAGRSPAFEPERRAERAVQRPAAQSRGRRSRPAIRWRHAFPDRPSQKCLRGHHHHDRALLDGAIEITLTSGTAARSVVSVSSAEADLRLRSPIPTTINTIAVATIAKSFCMVENGLRSTVKAGLSIWFPLFVFAELTFSISWLLPFARYALSVLLLEGFRRSSSQCAYERG